jgi:hypothetical protein
VDFQWELSISEFYAFIEVKSFCNLVPQSSKNPIMDGWMKENKMLSLMKEGMKCV